MAHKGQENLIPNSARTKEERIEIARAGGIAAGLARKRNAAIRDSLQRILNSGIKVPKIDPNTPMDKDIVNLLEKFKSIGVDVENLTLVDLMNFGQILGASYGKPECYRALLESSGELLETNEEQAPTPSLEITIKDNSKLEGKLYEANKH